MQDPSESEEILKESAGGDESVPKKNSSVGRIWGWCTRNPVIFTLITLPFIAIGALVALVGQCEKSPDFHIQILSFSIVRPTNNEVPELRISAAITNKSTRDYTIACDSVVFEDLNVSYVFSGAGSTQDIDAGKKATSQFLLESASIDSLLAVPFDSHVVHINSYFSCGESKWRQEITDSNVKRLVYVQTPSYTSRRNGAATCLFDLPTVDSSRETWNRFRIHRQTATYLIPLIDNLDIIDWCDLTTGTSSRLWPTNQLIGTNLPPYIFVVDSLCFRSRYCGLFIQRFANVPLPFQIPSAAAVMGGWSNYRLAKVTDDAVDTSVAKSTEFVQIVIGSAKTWPDYGPEPDSAIHYIATQDFSDPRIIKVQNILESRRLRVRIVSRPILSTLMNYHMKAPDSTGWELFNEMLRQDFTKWASASKDSILVLEFGPSEALANKAIDSSISASIGLPVKRVSLPHLTASNLFRDVLKADCRSIYCIGARLDDMVLETARRKE